MKRFRLELFTDKKGFARLRLVSRNGKIIMSSEAYSKPDKAKKTMKALWLATVGNGIKVELSDKELAK